MSTRSDLRESLPQDPDFRTAYADEILNILVCSQIKVLREQRNMSQARLAELLETTQSVISRIENVDYAAWSVDTLRRLAKAYDLRLRITFEGFGSLWRDVESIDRDHLERPRIHEDPEFQMSGLGEEAEDSDDLSLEVLKAVLHERETPIAVVRSPESSTASRQTTVVDEEMRMEVCA